MSLVNAEMSFTLLAPCPPRPPDTPIVSGSTGRSVGTQQVTRDSQVVEDESSTGYEQGAALEGRDKGSILHIEADNFDGLDNWTWPGVVQLSS